MQIESIVCDVLGRCQKVFLVINGDTNKKVVQKVTTALQNRGIKIQIINKQNPQILKKISQETGSVAITLSPNNKIVPFQL